MNEDSNKIKKILQTISDLLVNMKKYNSLEGVEVFFVFGSPIKSAMCDWVYGIRVYIKGNLRDSNIINMFQKDLSNYSKRYVSGSLCCTDVIYEYL